MFFLDRTWGLFLFFEGSPLKNQEDRTRQTTPVCGPPASLVPWETLRLNISKRIMKAQPKQPTCGKILAHCKRQITAFRESLGLQLCVFKIGVTASPAERFQSYLEKAFTSMWIIHMSDDLSLTHMLEAALISEFHTIRGCRNAPESGGEGGLNRKNHLGPPFYTYVTGGRADQPRNVG